jgi:hypothetical protein
MYKLVEAINAGKFCNFAIPVPESLQIVAGVVGGDDTPEQKALVESENRNLAEHGYKNWYDFCTNEWGTKWDIEPYDAIDYDDQRDGCSITFGFDSAWAPPLGVYRALEEQGYTVSAYYYEGGMNYCGKYEDGDDDYYNLEDMSSSEVRETIPEDLDELMGISESIANYEDEENEED